MLPGQGVTVAGGGAVWLPNQATSATLIGWYEVRADLVTLVSGDVSSISNRILGGANPLVQATGGAQPTFESGGWGTGGRDSLQFDGSADLLTANGLAASVAGTDVPFTVLLLGQMSTLGSVGSIRNIWGFGNSASDPPLHDLRLPASTTGVVSSARRDSGSTSRIKDAATAITTSRTMWSLAFTGTHVKLRVNGTLDANLDGVSSTADNDVGVLTGLDSFSVGAETRTTVAGHVNMRMGGMLVYAGALSDAELARAESYLEAGHPL
jgi:hypothetical protein